MPHPEADLSDAFRIVADPLQLHRNVERRDEQAEVGSNRLLHGDQIDHAVFDFAALVVDSIVFTNDLLGHGKVAGLERFHSFGGCLFDHAAKSEEIVLEMF